MNEWMVYGNEKGGWEWNGILCRSIASSERRWMMECYCWLNKATMNWFDSEPCAILTRNDFQKKENSNSNSNLKMAWFWYSSFVSMKLHYSQALQQSQYLNGMGAMLTTSTLHTLQWQIYLGAETNWFVTQKAKRSSFVVKCHVSVR